MKTQFRVLTAAISLFCAATAFAQTAAPVVNPPGQGSGMTKPVDGLPAVTARPKTANMDANIAAGGGDGKVWVNTKSKMYYCEGTKSYGTTKAGEYMTEDDAKVKGNRGKACSN